MNTLHWIAKPHNNSDLSTDISIARSEKYLSTKYSVNSKTEVQVWQMQAACRAKVASQVFKNKI